MALCPSRGSERLRSNQAPNAQSAADIRGTLVERRFGYARPPNAHEDKKKPPNAGSERLRAKGNARFLTQRKERRALDRTRERGPLGTLNYFTD